MCAGDVDGGIAELKPPVIGRVPFGLDDIPRTPLPHWHRFWSSESIADAICDCHLRVLELIHHRAVNFLPAYLHQSSG